MSPIAPPRQPGLATLPSAGSDPETRSEGNLAPAKGIVRHPVGRVRIRTHEYMEDVHENGMRSGLYPSGPDISVSVVNADGTETDISIGVQSVTWKVAMDGEPCVAVIEFVGAELQAHAKGIIELVPLKDDKEIPDYLAPAIEAAKP